MNEQSLENEIYLDTSFFRALKGYHLYFYNYISNNKVKGVICSDERSENLLLSNTEIYITYQFIPLKPSLLSFESFFCSFFH